MKRQGTPPLSEGSALFRLCRDEDVPPLTTLLNVAYAPLATAGLQFVAATQDLATTRARIDGAECWVNGGSDVIGTVTLRPPAVTHGNPWYDRPGVASFGQLAVAPGSQGRGLGTRLVRWAEERATVRGAAEIAWTRQPQRTTSLRGTAGSATAM